MERQYLAEALQAIAPDDFDRAVQIVLEARRLFVRGGGPSAMLADLTELRLARFALNVVAINESATIWPRSCRCLPPATPSSSPASPG